MGQKLRDALKRCNENYLSLTDEDGISSLSSIDTDIILTLANIIEKGIDDNNLNKIIEDYKTVSDIIILQLLDSYNDTYEGVGKKETIYYINIDNKILLNLSKIYSIERLDIYDYTQNLDTYNILINRTDSDKVPYANTIVKIDSEERRNEVINNIKEQMERYVSIIVV